MKKYLLATTAALALATAPAMAGDAYMGVDLNRTELDGLDGSGSGWNLYGGYRFNDSFAFEAGYRRLVNKTLSDFGTPVKLTGNALQASVLAYVPLGADFSLFGRLGVNRLDAKATVNGFTAKENDTKAMFGVGLEYSLSKAMALRAEFQKPSSDTEVLSLGLRFNF